MRSAPIIGGMLLYHGDGEAIRGKYYGGFHTIEVDMNY